MQISSQHFFNLRLGSLKFQPYLVVLGLVVNIYILQACWVRAIGLSTLLDVMTLPKKFVSWTMNHHGWGGSWEGVWVRQASSMLRRGAIPCRAPAWLLRLQKRRLLSYLKAHCGFVEAEILLLTKRALLRELVGLFTHGIYTSAREARYKYQEKELCFSPTLLS